jgi:GT2 family glycosyltransferase
MGHPRARFFSVVIPTYARPRQLAACLASLAGLDYDRASFEVVVVDDGSPTPLNEIVAAFTGSLNITLLRQDNAGPAAARNAGATRAKGNHLVFVDDDCAPAAEYLRMLAARFAVEPDCAIGGRTINALTENVWSSASQMLVDYLYSYYNADPHHARFLTSNNMAVPTHIFRELNGFDTGFRLAASEDRDLCDRLVHRGYRIIHAPEAIVYHSHAMMLGQYWRQHFTYGRGAANFHQEHSDRTAAAARFEPVSFYLNLLRFPFSQQSKSPAIILAALMLLSQAATVLGYLRERLATLSPPGGRQAPL